MNMSVSYNEKFVQKLAENESLHLSETNFSTGVRNVYVFTFKDNDNNCIICVLVISAPEKLNFYSAKHSAISIINNSEYSSAHFCAPFISFKDFLDVNADIVSKNGLINIKSHNGKSLLMESSMLLDDHYISVYKKVSEETV
jgi:hypothetical protein